MPTPRRARASISAMPNANRTWSGTATPVIQSVFFTGVQTCGSRCLSRSPSPAERSFTLPACHLVTNVCTRFVYEAPEAMIGEVDDFGFAKIFRKVEKCVSGISSFECVDADVDGTFRRPFDSSASACVFVVSHLTRSHA